MSSEEEDENAVYCICRSSDVNRFMIGCDHCEEWYHGDCIKVNERDAKYIKKYYCKICTDKNPKLQIIYKSKYKEKEKEISSIKGSSHSKEKDKESKTSHDRHREKFDELKRKHKHEDREKIREKDPEKRKDKDKKYLEYKEHKSKQGHESHHRKHHHRDKEYEDKEKKRERDKHRHKHDRDHDREKRKAKDKRREENNSHQNKTSVQDFQGISSKGDNVKDVEVSSLKKALDVTEKSETIDSFATVKSEATERHRIDIDKIKKESGSESPKCISKTPMKPEKLSYSEFRDEGEKKISSAHDKTPARKVSTEKDSSSTPTSKNTSNSSNKISVLKELKNIPEIKESFAIKSSIKSEEESEDSDERWTDKPIKSRKSKLAKEARKRAKSPNNKISKKRRHMDSVKNRRLARTSNYQNGDSSDDGNYLLFNNANTGDLRQCFGPRCVKPARPQSNYCSDECGINLASHRIVQTLPDRLREWHLTQCVADTRSRKELEKIKAEQDAVKNRLEQLNVDFQNLEELIDRGKLQPIEKEKEDEEEGDTEKPSEAEMTVHCVTCGQDLHTKTAIRHMERCYNKFESQTSFASKFKTQIENHRMFCDFFNPKDQTYCKRLQVLCPEHNPDPKFLDDEVCGYPIQKEIFAKPSEFCRLSKKSCQPHVFWEKLRRAEIDMERVRQWMKVDELIEQERVVRAAMLNRAGVLGLLLHSTFNHELDDRYKEAQRAKVVAQAKAKQAAHMMASNHNTSSSSKYTNKQQVGMQNPMAHTNVQQNQSNQQQPQYFNGPNS